jgi:hypothetical protein
LKKVEAEELLQARQEEEAKKRVEKERIKREHLKREEGCKRLLANAEARELDLMSRFRRLLAEAELLEAEARSNKKESEALKKVEVEELLRARQQEEAKKRVKKEHIKRESLKREEECKRLLADANNLIRPFRRLLVEAELSNEKESEALKKVEAKELLRVRQEEEAKKRVEKECIETEIIDLMVDSPLAAPTKSGKCLNRRYLDRRKPTKIWSTLIFPQEKPPNKHLKL